MKKNHSIKKKSSSKRKRSLGNENVSLLKSVAFVLAVILVLGVGYLFLSSISSKSESKLNLETIEKPSKTKSSKSARKKKQAQGDFLPPEGSYNSLKPKEVTERNGSESTEQNTEIQTKKKVPEPNEPSSAAPVSAAPVVEESTPPVQDPFVGTPTEDGAPYNILDIFEMIDKNIIDGISFLLKNGHNITGIKDGLSPFQYASKKRNAEVLKLLIEHKQFEDIDSTTEILTHDEEVDALQYTALHLVCLGTENPKKAVETATILVKNGADKDFRTSDDLTPLHRAILTSNAELVTYLLSAGAKTDFFDEEGHDSFLHFAIKSGSSRSVMKALIDKAPELMDTLNFDNQYPIHAAAFCGNVDALRELILILFQDRDRRTPIRAKSGWLILDRDPEDDEPLYSEIAKFHATPLHYAILGRKLDAAEFLVLIRTTTDEKASEDEEGLNVRKYAIITKDEAMFKFIDESVRWNNNYDHLIVEDVEDEVRYSDLNPGCLYSVSVFERIQAKYLCYKNPNYAR